MITGFFNYFFNQRQEILNLLVQHIQLTFLSVTLSIIIGVPLGIIISYIKRLSKPILGFANIVQAIPSMALLGFSIPFLGIGSTPAIMMVILYSLLPIIKNTHTGVNSISPEIIEAATGIGLTKSQILFKVELPLALPVIMAGVRISSVTAVGLMTIAAYVGAGGLGYMVFAGIRTVNNYQILSGAIPACILALLVDYITSLIEKIVTPISLQFDNIKSIKNIKHRLFREKIILSFSLLVVISIFSSKFLITEKKEDKMISVGSMMFTEQFVLANIVSDIIEERTDIKVNRKMGLGGTQIVISALQKGDIDLYIEYTGTIYTMVLGYTPTNNVDYVYDTSKKDFKEKYNFEVLKPFTFNNTYVLAIRDESSKNYNIKNISDLKKVDRDFVFCGTLEFLNRADGMIGLTNYYNLRFKKSVGIDDAPRYIAINSKEVDVVTAFSTDGLLEKFNLVSLKDDRSFFPPYYAVPVMRADAFEKYPEIIPILEELGDILTESVMRELNYQVDELQIPSKKVARDFLIKNKLIK